jgi:hypothetical protein
MKRYYLNGWIRIDAESDEEADRKFEEAGLGPQEEVIDGVTLGFEGPWDEIEEIVFPECICPPDLVARGGFRGGCPVHHH